MVVRALGNSIVPIGVFAVVGCFARAEARAAAQDVADEQVSPAWRDTLPHPRGQATPPSSFPARVWIWGAQRAPAPGPARVHGRTTSGCIGGAVALPARGPGFVRRRPWRRTAFGHPDLVDYIERLGEAARRAELGALMIGDMALPRGGAFAHGHRSHQTGLDVDIAYQTLPENGSVRSVGAFGSSLDRMPSLPRDHRPFETLLRLAAADPRVDRIFVAAGLKQLLCRSVTGDRGFLALLRPWQGHERHFHVRLKCPADSPDCRPNEPATAIPDCCEDVARGWKSPRTRKAFAEFLAAESASYARDLPSACHLLPELPRDMALLPSTPAHRRMSVAARRAMRSPHASRER